MLVAPRSGDAGVYFMPPPPFLLLPSVQVVHIRRPVSGALALTALPEFPFMFLFVSSFASALPPPSPRCPLHATSMLVCP